MRDIKDSSVLELVNGGRLVYASEFEIQYQCILGAILGAFTGGGLAGMAIAPLGSVAAVLALGTAGTIGGAYLGYYYNGYYDLEPNQWYNMYLK
jgi:hypothetical protein